MTLKNKISQCHSNPIQLFIKIPHSLENPASHEEFLKKQSQTKTNQKKKWNNWSFEVTKWSFCKGNVCSAETQAYAVLSLFRPLWNPWHVTSTFSTHSTVLKHDTHLTSSQKKGKLNPKSHLSTQQLSHVPLCNFCSSNLVLVLTSWLCNQRKQPHRTKSEPFYMWIPVSCCWKEIPSKKTKEWTAGKLKKLRFLCCRGF